MSAPKLVVFDLDFTLWDCGGTWCDCLSPPFQKLEGRVADGYGRHVRLYEDVHGILDWCDGQAIPIAVASRTEQPRWARELLDLLNITSRFSFAEIYPSSKLRHFEALRRDSGTEFGDMLFFDDEMRNIKEVSTLGVTSLFVDRGMDSEVFEQGIRAFADS